MRDRDTAVELLQHYVALALGKRSARELPADYRAELAELVDCIIRASQEPR